MQFMYYVHKLKIIVRSFVLEILNYDLKMLCKTWYIYTYLLEKIAKQQAMCSKWQLRDKEHEQKGWSWTLCLDNVNWLARPPSHCLSMCWFPSTDALNCWPPWNDAETYWCKYPFQNYVEGWEAVHVLEHNVFHIKALTLNRTL